MVFYRWQRLWLIAFVHCWILLLLANKVVPFSNRFLLTNLRSAALGCSIIVLEGLGWESFQQSSSSVGDDLLMKSDYIGCSRIDSRARQSLPRNLNLMTFSTPVSPLPSLSSNVSSWLIAAKQRNGTVAKPHQSGHIWEGKSFWTFRRRFRYVMWVSTQ